MAKFKFEDLQPHVDMLCDALENRGASSSGSPYNEKVHQQAHCYRKLLSAIRLKEISEFNVLMMLSAFKNETLLYAGNNQRYRIGKILDALDIFIRKEYTKINS